MNARAAWKIHYHAASVVYAPCASSMP